MPSLSLIEVEAQRLIGSLPENRRSAMRAALTELCEIHWAELRGSEPTDLLANTLWAVTPSWADLLIDLYAAGDWRLDNLLPGQSLAKGMALLVLAEIERGNEMGVHIVHEPMMAFESVSPPTAWLDRVSALLRGTLEPPVLHAHDHHGPLWKVLALIAIHTHRLDLSAVLKVIALLINSEKASATSGDVALQALRSEVLDAGIRFLAVEDDHIKFEQHGHAHKPVRSRQVGEMLLEIRQLWLQ